MANNTVEYKFKVTNNLDKDSTIIKKFNFYIGLPYSKRKYRYMQIINFATNKEGQHLFNVVLGHSIDSVAIMTNDILRGTHASLKPVTTKVSQITYTSLNVGTISLVCNDENEESIKNGDWTGISGEYMKVKSFRTNGNDDVLGLIFDAADRSLVSARKNDNTNVVAKPDIVKVPQPEKPVIDIDGAKLDPILLTSAARKAIKDSVDDLRKTNQELEQKLEGKEKDNCGLIEQIDEKDRFIKTLVEERDFLKNDIEARDKDISDLTEQLEDKERYIKGLENDSVKMFQNMDWRRKYIELVLAVLKRDFSHMKDEDLVANVQSLIDIPGMEK